MKNVFILFSILFSSLTFSQNVFWYDVMLEVEGKNASTVASLVDDFYSSIDFPENSSLTLNAIQNKSEWTKATHFLNFAGTPDGLAQLRELRSGEAYEAYVENLEGLAKIVAMKQGQSLVRIQGENGSYSEQMWSFYVDDPGTFAQAFIKLNAEDCCVIFAFTENLGSVLPSPLPASINAPQYSLTDLKVYLSREASAILQP